MVDRTRLKGTVVGMVFVDRKVGIVIAHYIGMIVVTWYRSFYHGVTACTRYARDFLFDHFRRMNRINCRQSDGLVLFEARTGTQCIHEADFAAAPFRRLGLTLIRFPPDLQRWSSLVSDALSNKVSSHTMCMIWNVAGMLPSSFPWSSERASAQR